MVKSEMPSAYDPKKAEEKWYDFWMEKGFFTAGQDQSKKPYTIVIPPPNVTGNLHIGHALNNALQDLLIRFKRMQGYDALWLPGTDHAGIATQTKVEERLREEGLTRHDLGREKFLEQVWEWKEKYANVIHSQWKKMGLSLDYSRERFTMDEGLSKAVREVFVRLYEKGFIYRGKYIINWDPAARTALSDIEVIYKDVQGALYHLEYPLQDGSGSIRVATTRPETMLGDTGIAVHPEDERYKSLIGKRAILPIIGREIPIVADEHVDPEFGSGAVKITPAHDPNDFEIGQRHQLPQVLIMDESGVMNKEAGPYQGLDRFQCRKQIVKDLQDAGVLIEIEEHMHSVGHSERSGAVVEPYLSTQWFVRMEPLAEQAIKDTKSGESAQFVPDRFEKIYLHWIENIRDWCISRQLWWGHRIPAWYCEDCGEVTVKREDATSCEHCQSDKIKQDNDVLDTWFSSALWPFSTLGWPAESEDFKRYFPTDVLITGYDIIYFWVARMIFTSLEFTEQKPFQDVLITGLIRDAEGRKMSKSLGNGIDPLEVIEKYGVDAMRFMLSTGCTPGNDQRFRWERVEAARNFSNKIWNASRFALMHVESQQPADLQLTAERIKQLSTADRWILHRLNETIADVTRLLERYDFGEVGRLLYNFVWDDVCDWYIEFAKLPLYGENEEAKQRTRAVLVYVLDQSLRLLHPFMPFVTEEIWQHLPLEEGESITIASWPTARESFSFSDAEGEMNLLIDLIRSVRNIRAEEEVEPGHKVDLLIKADESAIETIENSREAIQRLCQTKKLEIGTQIEQPARAMSAVVTGAEIFLPLEGLIDISQTIARLEAEKKKLDQEVLRVEKKLSNKGFVSKAPAHVVEEEKRKGEEYAEKRSKVIARLQELQD
ncbi:valine--tRNA ligase [Mechercharimyces sp. CAU 1602]|uniref:valine--tRNA ligase n=1 Tax=Mechercharimyces sp. CAU 1602 TaxID=2973933 RepID=UPI002163863F|nr:valine--tRNA ligase [Mechercharimyces sp. CAU 1602]MCS1351451.1 valine--tRNA ligase [Mechercharimyces sp. CAU 1602]